jgi:predicted DNA-binding transcriptional regulator YafY
MPDKTHARQLQILLLLRSRQVIKAAEFARRFCVSIRTIHRDIEDLIAAGIPVQPLQGRRGGLRLVADNPLDSVSPDPDLAWQLYQLSGWAGSQASEDRNARPITSAGLVKLAERIHFDTADWYWRDEGSGHLPNLRTALQLNLMVEVDIREKGQTETKTFVLKPYGIVWKSGQWYLVAAASRSAPQRYSLNQIVRLEITDGAFQYPAEFQLRDWWREEMEVFGAGDTKIVLRIEADAVHELSRLSLKEDSRVQVTSDGVMVLTLFVDAWQWLIPLVASYGEAVGVVEPIELQRAVQYHHNRALAQYVSGEATPEHDGFENDDSRLRTTRGRPV